MSTLMSTDMNVTRSTTRRHAPPGGATTISLGSGDTPAAPKAAEAAAANASATTLVAPLRPSFGGAVGVAYVAGSSVKPQVLAALSEANAAVTTMEVGDPLSLPFAAQRLLAGGCAVVVAVGSLTGSQLWRASVPALVSALLTLSLDAGRPVVMAILLPGDEDDGKLGAHSAAEALRLSKMVKSKSAAAAGSSAAAAGREAHGSVFDPPKALSPDLDTLMGSLRAALKQQGASGILGLGRKFRIADDDRSGQLDAAEFAKCVKECKLDWPEAQVAKVFAAFDEDKSGGIHYDEFLLAAQGVPNARRAQLILAAFELLDVDKSGAVELDDIRRRYDASKHPDVAAGRRKADEVLREFLDTFDGGEKDGKVTPEEFCRYYAGVSASIDLDDYFELMIRNAWHISGGEGWSANSTCKRVLVTHTDGRQTVEEVKNDLGMDPTDKAAMVVKLKEQGVDVASVELFGSLDTTIPPAAKGDASFSGKASPVRGGANSNNSSAATSPYSGRVRQTPGGTSTIRLG